MNIFKHKGFTLVEIMIVVAIIAIALSIAIPNYFHMTSVSKRTACINNLGRIAGAVEQWALDKNTPSGTTLTPEQEDTIYSDYLRDGKPVCPSGGVYTINTVGTNPQVQCSREDEGHKL